MTSAMESDSVEDGYYTLENIYSRNHLNVSDGAGYVVFIHAIIDGIIYYYRYCGKAEGSVIVKTVSEFTNYFLYHYSGPTGAIHFVK